ncbi:HEL137Wp [Eremothecium sinecaudum]|uniref:HEL137Wp n=1 Tax=Eremothecium sinecaudum TaxID=45286 RepID=A0A0X8HTG6_9SACH|nr:HEL137Wp [Eremothecium sinecaudum]AMD21144.1 HEL137Wp [Eremothecium sinecaudum]
MVSKDESCELLGPVSLFIQVFMGIIGVSFLLLKREYEHPKRPWRVWLYDIGKQVTGAVGVHFFNVLTSVSDAPMPYPKLKSMQGDSNDDSECDWYFVNLLMDTTIGIPIIWFWLSIIQSCLAHLNVSNIESGNYYSHYDKNALDNQEYHNIRSKPIVTAFVKQLLIFLAGLSLMKFCVYLILRYFAGAAYWFADIILGWSDPWPNFQVFLVMFVAPIVFNCFQYFCIDNIIKLSSESLRRQNVENLIGSVPYLDRNIITTNNRRPKKANYGSIE